MAELYVKGPEHVRGRWEECAAGAGLDTAPSRDDPVMRGLVEKLGGAVLPDPPSEDAGELNPISALMTASELGIPWVELRQRLIDVIQGAASGTLKVSAAQASILKDVIRKAEEEMAGQAEKKHHVLLLPVQGGNATAQLDPEWRARLQQVAAPDGA